MKVLKVIFIVILIGLIVIQFFPVDKNIDDTTEAGSEFIAMYEVSPEIQKTLKASCFDCHSNNTEYLWYHKIQPVTWYIQDHVNEGKEEFNFDEFKKYSAKKRKHMLEESAEQIEEGEMPLTSYTLIHQNAKLDDVEQQQLAAFFKDLLKQEGQQPSLN